MDSEKYISVENAIKTAWMILDGLGYAFDENPQLKEAVSAVYDTAPKADVRPVGHGKWKLGGYGQISDATVKWYDQFLTGGFLYCSACKERSSVKTNFCPNCGADMREENDNKQKSC